MVEKPPDVVAFGSPERRSAPLVRRLRWLAETVAVIAVVGVAIVLLPDRDPPVAPAVEPVPSAGATPATTARRLVVPKVLRAGERVTVLGYRHARRCTPTTLLFSGAAVRHRAERIVEPVDGEWVELFMTMDVPTSARTGRHEVVLLGPMPGGPGGVVCGETPERRGRLAIVTVTVVPRP
jgi:hypothetical protein